MFYPKSPFISNRLVETQLIKGNATLLEELLPWLCRAPKVTTYRVNLLRTTVEAFKLRVERILAERYANPPKVFTIPNIPEVLCIGPVHDDARQPDDAELKEITVDSCCGAALLRGAHIYAPGVLSMETGTKLHEEVRIFSDLEGKCKKGTNTRYESEQKVFIGHGTVCMQRYQLYGENVAGEGVAVEMKSTVSGVPSIGDLSTNEALLQNFPSIVCVRVLDPQRGERVLDMCSAPGNKTTHIAELMQDDGIVVALDKSESKIKYVREKIADYELKSVRPFAYDATKAFDRNADIQSELMAPPFPSSSFDRILLDAPCSALGNRPMLATKGLTPKMLQSYPKVQRKLFDSAVELLKPGGVLVYSTCTITSAENEEMVEWVLKKFPQLSLVDAVPKFGGPGLPGMGLSEDERYKVQRFGPLGGEEDEDKLDTVGFFIAKFRKHL